MDIIDDPAILAGPFDVIAANFSLFEEDLHSLLVALRARLHPAGSLIAQTMHPADGEDGWRVETFASMSGEWHEAMPWYFRTRPSWERTFGEAGFRITDAREPMHPDEGRPLSILFRCSPTA